jgi:acetylornithine deacetylase/succinyl-diaminopimelate desuccinylase-like protein
MSIRARPGVVAFALAGQLLGSCPSQATEAQDRDFRALYEELVNINTTRSAGSCTQAAEAMRAHLLAAGVPAADAQILAPPERPRDGALIAMLHGRDRSLKPILLLAHIDVVEAKREDWQRDPFKLAEEEGTFYGRGASDDKAMAAVFTDALVRYAREGFRPLRGLKLALTCGEETPDVFNSVSWLMQTDPKVLDAAFALNEGAFGELDKNGQPVILQLQAGEKVYQDFSLEASDVGGHSARPTHNNPIVRLSEGVARLGHHDFAIALNPVTRSYFEAQAKLVAPQVGRDIEAVLDARPDEAAAERLWAVSPAWNAALRTTCVVTEIAGGHAANALPQRVRATVNCRILPGVPVAEVRNELVRVLGDESIRVVDAGVPGLPSPAPPLSEHIIGPVRAVANRIWPGVVIMPTMLVAATDGRFLNARGVPTYGLSGLFYDADGSHAHGLNEHVRVKSLMDGRRFLYEVVKLYANQADAAHTGPGRGTAARPTPAGSARPLASQTFDH